MQTSFSRIWRPLALLAGIALALILGGAALAHASVAATDSTPAPDPLGWLAYAKIALAAGLGAATVLGIIQAGLTWLAPRTKTTVDDTLRDDVRFLHDKLDAALKLLGGLIPAAGVPAALVVPVSLAEKPAAPALTIAPPLPRDTQAGVSLLGCMLALALGGAIALAVAACTAAQRTATPHALVDCTAANAAAIGATAGSMRAEKPDGCAVAGVTDWSCVQAKAIAAGLAIGGCAFLEVVTVADKAPAAAAPGATGPGRAAFESYRASVAGGAAFRTVSGDR